MPCLAPAGSGKTTTLVARVAWLVDGGADSASITAITFNTRAGEELGERANAALRPLAVTGAHPKRLDDAAVGASDVVSCVSRGSQR